MRIAMPCYLICVVGLAWSAAGCSQGKSDNDAKSPDKNADWKPHAAMLDKLTDEVEIDGYAIRPPKGYPRIAEAPSPLPGHKSFMWAGDKRPDGSVPVFTVSFGTPKPGDIIPPTYLDRLHSIWMEGVQKRRTNWKPLPTERGTIAGLSFIRGGWSCNEAGKAWTWHGVMYAGIDRDRAIQVQFDDVEPHADETLKVAEAAALTFRKK